MISFQQSFFSPTVDVTHEHWNAIITSKEFARSIANIRALRAEGKQKEADAEKRRLPALCYQATFDETESKKGIRGKWRKQAAARLNGLYMLDIDHIGAHPLPLPKGGVVEHPTPRDYFNVWAEEHPELFSKPLPSGGDGGGPVLFVHVTSSGEGLRLVAKADVNRGNIADNQHWLADQLGVVCDESCKDASRLSFIPTWDDIIYSDYKQLLDYNNEEFDKKFGDEYRGGRSAATRHRDNNGSTHTVTDVKGNVHVDRQGGSESLADSGVGDGCNAGTAATEVEPSELDLEYHGAKYGKIIECWLDANAEGWRDAMEGNGTLDGDRHRLLLKLACDLRYICDKKEVFTALVQKSPLGTLLCKIGRAEEVDHLADDSLRYRLWREIPQRMRSVLAAAGVREYAAGNGAAGQRAGIDYEAWWKRLEPLLDESPYLRDACALLPPLHRIGGVLASGAMFGTYLSRCWWEHFDGKTYRLSYIVYVIGDAASGKSVMVDLDRLIMAPMLAADKVGREWERQYKEEMKARSASSKNAKEAAPEQQHPVIRYLPSTISNAMLYRRLTDAIDTTTTDAHGEPTHLHCYTFEAELATALRAQQGSWAGKLDLECKSFQNEMAGVDYANDQSQNGIIEINWNQVITGTPDALRRKIRKSTVLDGLVTRLAVFPMPSNDYAMIDRRKRIVEHERDCRLRAVGLDLDKLCGELPCERLVDFCYDYEQQLRDQAELNEDKCLDYFRKRIPLIMIRYALVRSVLRQLKELQQGEPLQISDSDLEFARLIGDFVLDMQIHMFGSDVMEAMEQQAAAFTPRRRSNKVKERFEKLPKEFTRNELKAICLDMKNTSISTMIKRWLEEGIIERQGEKYVKKVSSIE